MDARTHERYDARARIVKSLAHPTRLFMVDALSRRERCVQELTGMVGADISTVSKHLTILKAAGIVEVEKRGAQVFYSLRCPCVTNFFGCVEAVLKASARKEAAAVR